MEKHYAIFKQKKIRRLYDVEKEYRYDYVYSSDRVYTGKLILTTKSEDVEEVLIWEGEIPNPKLHNNEQIYIEELSKVVTVGYGLRTTSDKMFYYLQNNEVIQDEKSIKSKEEALKLIEEHNKQFEGNRGTFKSNEKKWYQIFK